MLPLLIVGLVVACGTDPWPFPEGGRSCGDGDDVSTPEMDCASAWSWRSWAAEKAGADLGGCSIQWVDASVFASSGSPELGGLTSLDPRCRIAVLGEAPHLLAHEALHVRLGTGHCGWRARPILDWHADAGIVGGYLDECNAPPVLCAGNAEGWSCRPE